MSLQLPDDELIIGQWVLVNSYRDDCWRCCSSSSLCEAGEMIITRQVNEKIGAEEYQIKNWLKSRCCGCSSNSAFTVTGKRSGNGSRVGNRFKTEFDKQTDEMVFQGEECRINRQIVVETGEGTFTYRFVLEYEREATLG